MQRSAANAVRVAVLLLCLAGCTGEVRFQPNEVALAELQVVPEHRAQLDAAMQELFGTPDQPRMPRALAGLVDEGNLRNAAGAVASHTPGVTVGLYRRHCAACHGVTGDGMGPAALYQAPYPRDFRQGVFKYKSTYRSAAPTDADLAATLRHGVSGAAMPSFALLSVDEIGALVDYVKYLAMRGWVEQELITYAGEELDFDPATGKPEAGSRLDLEDDDLTDFLELEVFPRVARFWQDAESQVVVPTGRGVSREGFASLATDGEKLFHDELRANCVKCHGKQAQGGVEWHDFDLWNKRRRDFIAATDRLEAQARTQRERLAAAPEERREFLAQDVAARDKEIATRRRAESTLLPPRESVARRLTRGALASTRSPEDLFRRVHQGIAGSPMPAVGPPGPHGASAVSDEEVWQLAAYVLQLTQGATGAEPWHNTIAERPNDDKAKADET